MSRGAVAGKGEGGCAGTGAEGQCLCQEDAEVQVQTCTCKRISANAKILVVQVQKCRDADAMKGQKCTGSEVHERRNAELRKEADAAMIEREKRICD